MFGISFAKSTLKTCFLPICASITASASASDTEIWLPFEAPSNLRISTSMIATRFLTVSSWKRRSVEKQRKQCWTEAARKLTRSKTKWNQSRISRQIIIWKVIRSPWHKMSWSRIELLLFAANSRRWKPRGLTLSRYNCTVVFSPWATKLYSRIPCTLLAKKSPSKFNEVFVVFSVPFVEGH